MFNVPGCPVSSNCGTPTEKASKFLNHHLQSIIKSGESYVKDTNDYLGKLKKLQNLSKVLQHLLYPLGIPKGAVLVIADVVGLYWSIPYKDGLNALGKLLEEHEEKKNPTETLLELAKLTFPNNFFKFGLKIVKQKLGDSHWG